MKRKTQINLFVFLLLIVIINVITTSYVMSVVDLKLSHDLMEGYIDGTTSYSKLQLLSMIRNYKYPVLVLLGIIFFLPDIVEAIKKMKRGKDK